MISIMEDNMSTRSLTVLKGGKKDVWFYRHCDGYPEVMVPCLEKKLKKLTKPSEMKSFLIGDENFELLDFIPTAEEDMDAEFVYIVNPKTKKVCIREKV